MLIRGYEKKFQTEIITFFQKAFKEDNREINLDTKDTDLENIDFSYMSNGFFWCAFDDKNKICGTIAIRPRKDFFEIRRFFVLKKYKNRGIGQQLLSVAIEYAIDNNYSLLKAATLNRGKVAQHIFEKFGFKNTERYDNSTADLFFELKIDLQYSYNFTLSKLNNHFKNSLILNPTENIPYHYQKYNSQFFEGLYVSERFKDVNDKVIFAGRNEYIKFFEYIKTEWKKKLSAVDVDLKTLSGLNAHLILFLCIINKNDTIMLLPEICGGHFATEKIIESLGANVISMIPDLENLCVDKEKTSILIEETKPQYIFVDRSEGLVYEDFSWLKKFNYSYKIFDASQYLSQIITGIYPNPFETGFDMIISTLHKNYPGPQKGILAVKENDSIWKKYLANAKTYISNTHPLSIANSLIPLLNYDEFIKYSDINIKCTQLLEKHLILNGVPVIKRNNEPATLHIWVLCNTKEESYSYYLKLERLNILTNYRLLPYDLGYGLRIGTSAAVRFGLRPKHIEKLSEIMSDAYHNQITEKLIKKANKLIKQISTEGLSDMLV